MKRTYEDFDEFSEAIAGLSGRLMPTARSRAPWWMSQARIAEITVHHLQIGARVSFAGHATPNSLFLALPLNEPPGILVNGQPLGEHSVCVLPPGQSLVLAARPATQCIGVVLPASDAVIGSVLSQRRSVFSTAHAVCEPDSLSHLRVLARQASRWRPGGASVDVVKQLRMEIIDAVRAALQRCEAPSEKRLGRPQYSRACVIARCLSLAEAGDGRPLRIADLCAATGISERTLRNIFREYFGVGPKRLLKVRKLVDIRAALLRAQSGEQTVRQVTRRFGIRDFSLFASHYKALFGESPSTTLRRSSNRIARPALASWLNYASRALEQGPAPDIVQQTRRK